MVCISATTVDCADNLRTSAGSRAAASAYSLQSAVIAMDTGQFENRTVVVTGAAKGIGAATARAFFREGARVALLDVDESAASLAREMGDRAKFVRCDVSRDGDVRSAINTVVDALGDIAVL